VDKFLGDICVPNHGEFKKTNKKGISESLGIQDKQFTPHYPLQKL
jgi:hypothetical protein